MRRPFAIAAAATLLAATTAQAAAPPERLMLEAMTWPEVKAQLAAGRTTALIYTGGTEQRGPQNVLGGHTLMGRATVRAIAAELGDALALPVLPYTPTRPTPDFPASIGLRPDTFERVLEDLAEAALANGFRDVVLMGDHGAGQEAGGAYARVAQRVTERHAGDGKRVVFCDAVYAPANAEFDRRTVARGLPRSIHAGLSDTSEMLYLDPDGSWVRRSELRTAVGIPVSPQGERRPTPGSPRNGITGDARRASKALGKAAFDLKVAYAVAQIRQLLATP